MLMNPRIVSAGFYQWYSPIIWFFYPLLLIYLIPLVSINTVVLLAHLSWKLKWAFLITFCPSSVRLSVCPSVCPSVRLSVNFFTFSTSSQEPLGQFQPNLAQIILRLRGFKIVNMKGQALFQGEIIRKHYFFFTIFKNLLLRNHFA